MSGSKDLAPRLVPAAVAAMALSLTPVTTLAEGGHGPHVHGAGQLNLAWVGSEMQMELTVPGRDIVGFEHSAETAEDRAAVEKALATLSDAASLFALPPEAGCELEHAKVASSQLEGDHDREHADEHKHDDEHKLERAGAEAAAHAEFSAVYHFDCSEPGALSHVQAAGLFAAFPSLQELETRFVTATGQGAAELTASDSRLGF